MLQYLKWPLGKISTPPYCQSYDVNTSRIVTSVSWSFSFPKLVKSKKVNVKRKMYEEGRSDVLSAT